MHPHAPIKHVVSLKGHRSWAWWPVIAWCVFPIDPAPLNGVHPIKGWTLGVLGALLFWRENLYQGLWILPQTNIHSPLQPWNIFCKAIQSLHLVGCWKSMHVLTGDYNYYTKVQKTVSRIDLLYVEQFHLDHMERATIEQNMISDHTPMKISYLWSVMISCVDKTSIFWMILQVTTPI